MRKKLRLYAGCMLATLSLAACSSDYGEETLDQIEEYVDQLEELTKKFEMGTTIEAKDALGASAIMLKLAKLDTLDESKLSDKAKERYKRIEARLNELIKE